uniref:Uncharacterized protein n=1 Tax=Onchocerca volvulus TaxID=6282 RepID=A0A8R1Y3X2_ONCVO
MFLLFLVILIDGSRMNFLLFYKFQPLSDSEFISYSTIQRKPVLRIFETDDLPLHRGDFTLQHAIMVRSRQLSEVRSS